MMEREEIEKLRKWYNYTDLSKYNACIDINRCLDEIERLQKIIDELINYD